MINRKMIYDRSIFEAGIWVVKDMYDTKTNKVISFDALLRRGVLKGAYLTWQAMTNIARKLTNIARKHIVDIGL